MKTNLLYYGDNLPILRHRDYFPDASVDLIYLDPPFNSKADYNILFREASGERSQAQIRAFSDFWHWDDAVRDTYHYLLTQGPPNVSKMMEALCAFIGHNDMTAYLVMMAARLLELHRVLKPTGSIYLHCDPTASHYLKVVMDTTFGKQNFRNEIVWRRGHINTHTTSAQFPRNQDVLLLYSKTPHGMTYTRLFKPYSAATLKMYRYDDGDGRGLYRLQSLRTYGRETIARMRQEGRIVDTRSGAVFKQYLSDKPGVVVDGVWEDILSLQGNPAERLGYQTQKPLALLERIIQASSNPGDIVLDPFCGCGTAVVAAQKLGRQWIGIDVTHLAIAVMRKRLRDTFGESLQFEVVGEPVDLEGARALAAQDRYQFQWWVLSLIGAMPVDGPSAGRGKKGADRGIDGLITFMDAPGGKAARAIVSVKSGHVQRDDIDKLKGVIETQKAALGLFITLEPPTEPMRTEAAAGFHRSELWQRDFPRIQILTVEELLAGKRPAVPGQMSPYAPAQRIRTAEGKQLELGD